MACQALQDRGAGIGGVPWREVLHGHKPALAACVSAGLLLYCGSACLICSFAMSMGLLPLYGGFACMICFLARSVPDFLVVFQAHLLCLPAGQSNDYRKKVASTLTAWKSLRALIWSPMSKLYCGGLASPLLYILMVVFAGQKLDKCFARPHTACRRLLLEGPGRVSHIVDIDLQVPGSHCGFPY